MPRKINSSVMSRRRRRSLSGRSPVLILPAIMHVCGLSPAPRSLQFLYSYQFNCARRAAFAQFGSRRSPQRGSNLKRRICIIDGHPQDFPIDNDSETDESQSADVRA